MITVLYRIHLLIIKLEMVDTVFISNIQRGEKSKIVERQRERERVCVWEAEHSWKQKGSVNNKIDH